MWSPKMIGWFNIGKTVLNIHCSKCSTHWDPELSITSYKKIWKSGNLFFTLLKNTEFISQKCILSCCLLLHRFVFENIFTLIQVSYDSMSPGYSAAFIWKMQLYKDLFASLMWCCRLWHYKSTFRGTPLASHPQW